VYSDKDSIYIKTISTLKKITNTISTVKSSPTQYRKSKIILIFTCQKIIRKLILSLQKLSVEISCLVSRYRIYIVSCFSISYLHRVLFIDVVSTSCLVYRYRIYIVSCFSISYLHRVLFLDIVSTSCLVSRYRIYIRAVYCQHEFDTIQYFHFQYPIYRIYSKHMFYAVVMLRYREEGGFSGPNFFSNNTTNIDLFHSQHLQCMCLANELKF
jgi:hypothetical protein